jgi:hypothetical protein
MSTRPWIRLVQGSINNCDAVKGSAHSSVVVVARDWRGTVVSAISKKVNTTFLLQEEAEAIVWANQLVVDMDLVMAWYVKLV